MMHFWVSKGMKKVPRHPQIIRFMNLSCSLQSCAKKSCNYWNNYKHMLQQEEKRKKNHLHSSSDGFDVWPHNPDRFLNHPRPWGSSREADTHTQPGPGLICGDHCTDPDQIRCQWTKLPSFPLVVAVWEHRRPPASLRIAGLKGERHALLNFRPDQKECDLGLGRRQSLSAQKRGFWKEKIPSTTYLQVNPGFPKNKIKLIWCLLFFSFTVSSLHKDVAGSDFVSWDLQFWPKFSLLWWKLNR